MNKTELIRKMEDKPENPKEFETLTLKRIIKIFSQQKVISVLELKKSTNHTTHIYVHTI